MVKKKGELTTVEAARMLGVDERTPRRWAKTILADGEVQPRGAERPLRKARRDIAGFYYLSRSEIAGFID